MYFTKNSLLDHIQELVRWNSDLAFDTHGILVDILTLPDLRIGFFHVFKVYVIYAMDSNKCLKIFLDLTLTYFTFLGAD